MWTELNEDDGSRSVHGRFAVSAYRGSLGLFNLLKAWSIVAKV